MPRRLASYLETASLAAILILAAYLRLANTASNPGWYTDEGTHLDIARHLVDGRVQYLAINQSTLLFAKLPLFDLLLAGLLRLGGDGMLTLRMLTGSLGIVSVTALCILVRRATQSRGLTLLSALMLAVYPQAVLYSRFGFSYNLLSPLVLLTCLGLWNYLDSARRRWLALAFLSIGVGAVSDLWMLALAVPALLAASLRRWQDALWGLPLLGLPLALYVAVMLMNAPQAFWFDLSYTLSRLGTQSIAEQLASIGQNYVMLLAQDSWMAPALIGLMMLRPARLQCLCLLMFLFPLAALGRTVALFSLGTYYTIPLLAFVALGMASLVWNGMPHVFRLARSGLAAMLSRWFPNRPSLESLLSVAASLSLLLIIFPLWVGLIGTLRAVKDGFATPIDPFLISASDARKTADFINAHTTSSDVVIASPTIGWLLDAQTADFQMATAATGQATPHLPANIPASRFAFDPRFDRAQYLVIDNLWRSWGIVHVPGLSGMLDELATRNPIFTAGDIAVYEAVTK
jgi:hypothetical protein